MPSVRGLELELAAFDEREHLITVGSLWIAARGNQNVVRFGAVTDYGGVLLESKARPLPFDGAQAAARIAANASLRSGRRDQALPLDELGQVSVECRRFRVANDAPHLNLVHRVDHSRGGTTLRQRFADGAELADARAGTAQSARHVHAEEALAPERLDGLGREPCVSVHVVRVKRGDLGCHRSCPLYELRTRSWAHAPPPPRISSIAERIAATLSKDRRRIMRSGNSSSKCSSSASIKLTVA
jgi:hypothetical protein